MMEVEPALDSRLATIRWPSESPKERSGSDKAMTAMTAACAAAGGQSAEAACGSISDQNSTWHGILLPCVLVVRGVLVLKDAGPIACLQHPLQLVCADHLQVALICRVH